MNHSDMREMISFLIVKIAKQHRQEISTDFSKLGIYAGQDMILGLLWEEEGLTQSQIIERLKVEPPTITKMIHRMEGSGLVEKKRDRNDGRVSRIYLTAHGRCQQLPVNQAWLDLEEKLLHEVTSEERLMLKDLLIRLGRNLS